MGILWRVSRDVEDLLHSPGDEKHDFLQSTCVSHVQLIDFPNLRYHHLNCVDRIPRECG